MTTVKNTVLYKRLKNSAQPYFWQSPENLKMDWSERKAKSEPSCNLVLIQFIQRNPMITKTPEFHHLFFGGESNHAILFAFQTFLSHHLCQIWLACEPLFDGWLIRCSPPLFLFLQVLLFNGPCPASEPSDAELIAETGFKELGPTRPGSSASSSLWLTSSIGFNIDDSVCTNKLQAHCWRISPQTSHHSCHGWITSYRLLGFKFKTMFLFSLYEMANMGEAQNHSV